MKKTVLIFIALCIFSLNIFSKESLSGIVLDKSDNSPVELATVTLKNIKDSTLVSGGITDSQGRYSITAKNGDFFLEVKFLGYKDYHENVSLLNKSIGMKKIMLEPDSKLLSEVKISGTAAQMTIKNDTIEYSTAAYKTSQNAVIEDLLKKLPGVEVDDDGKITVNGEEIKKVRVDGKKFFGDDIEMATKNLPVNIVDKIQVLDQKSDIAELTGFEDDDTERIINLTIKKNRKHGVFGYISGGLGADTKPEYDLSNTNKFIDNDARYDANASINLLNGDSQTSIVAGANNINNTRSKRGRQNFGNKKQGITTTQNIGINHNSKLTDDLLFGGNAGLNHSENNINSTTEKETWLSDNTYQTNSKDIVDNENYEANINTEFEWDINSNNKIILQPSYTNSKNIVNSYKDASYVQKIGDGTNNDTINTSLNKKDKTTYNNELGLNLIYNKKSTIRPGRTFTYQIGGDFSNSNSDGHNYSNKTVNQTNQNTQIDQNTQDNSDSYATNFKLSYVEPLWNNKNSLQFSIGGRYSHATSKKLRFNQDNISEKYNLLDSTYSNNFRNDFYKEQLEVKYLLKDSNYNVLLGFKIEPSQIHSENISYNRSNDRDITNNVWNFSPTASIKYNFGKKEFFRLEYRGRTSQPSINQMQPVKNIDNLTYETVGNQNLEPSYSHNMMFLYSKFYTKTFASLITGAGGALTQNALVTNSIFDITGKQWTQTVNSENSPYSARAFLMFNTPLFSKFHFNTRSSINFNTKYGYTDRIATGSVFSDENNETTLIMGKESKTYSTRANESLRLSYTHDLFELSAKGSIKYSNTANSLKDYAHQETYDISYGSNLDLFLPYSMTLSSDLNNTNYIGYSSFDNDELIWNASIEKSLFKKKGTISLKCYDILQNKLSIVENIGDNYRSIINANTLGSYYMLSFTYKIADFNNSEKKMGPNGLPPRHGEKGFGDRPRGAGNSNFKGHGGMRPF